MNRWVITLINSMSNLNSLECSNLIQSLEERRRSRVSSRFKGDKILLYSNQGLAWRELVTILSLIGLESRELISKGIELNGNQYSGVLWNILFFNYFGEWRMKSNVKCFFFIWENNENRWNEMIYYATN